MDPRYDASPDNHLVFGDVMETGRGWRTAQLDFLEQFFAHGIERRGVGALFLSHFVPKDDRRRIGIRPQSLLKIAKAIFRVPP